MTDTKHEAQGLEVVAWRIGFPNNAGYKVYEQPQPWAHQQYGVPPVTFYEVQELCRLSDATAVIDQLREELAKAHEYGYQYRQERNRAQQELAALKSAPAVMSERCRIEGCLSHEEIADVEGWDACLGESESLNRSKTNEQ